MKRTAHVSSAKQPARFNPPSRTDKENENPNSLGKLAESYAQHVFKHLPISNNSIIRDNNGKSITEIDVSFGIFGHTMTTGLEVKYRSNSNNAAINADIRKITSQNDKQNETHGGMSSFYIFDSKITKTKYAQKFKESNIELIEITRIEELLDKIADPNLASVGNHFFIVKNEQNIKEDIRNLDRNYSAKQTCFDALLCGLKAEYEKHIDEAKKNNEKSQSDTFLSVMVPLIKYMYGEDKCDRAENEIIELLYNYRKFLQQFDYFEKFVESKQSNTIMQQIKTNWDHQVHKDQAEAKSLSEKKQELKSIINAIRTKTEEIKVKLPEDFPEADGLTNDNDVTTDVTTIESTIRLFINTLPTTDAHNKTLPKTDALNYRKPLSEVWEKAIDNTKTIESQRKQLKDQSKKQLKDQSQIDQQVKAEADKAAKAAKAAAEAAKASPPRPKAAAANKTVAAASSGYPAEAKAAAIKAQAAEAKPETAKAETKPKLSKSQKKAKAKEAAEKEAAEKKEADQAQAEKTKAAKEERAIKQEICAEHAKESNRLTQLLTGQAARDLSKAINKKPRDCQ